LLILTVIFGSVVALPIWINNWMDTVIKVKKAGLIEEATFSDGFTHDSTTVRTDVGIFKVHGTFQATFGHEAEIRTYQMVTAPCVIA